MPCRSRWGREPLLWPPDGARRGALSEGGSYNAVRPGHPRGGDMGIPSGSPPPSIRSGKSPPPGAFFGDPGGGSHAMPCMIVPALRLKPGHASFPPSGHEGSAGAREAPRMNCLCGAFRAPFRLYAMQLRLLCTLVRSTGPFSFSRWRAISRPVLFSPVRCFSSGPARTACRRLTDAPPAFARRGSHFLHRPSGRCCESARRETGST